MDVTLLSVLISACIISGISLFPILRALTPRIRKRMKDENTKKRTLGYILLLVSSLFLYLLLTQSTHSSLENQIPYRELKWFALIYTSEVLGFGFVLYRFPSLFPSKKDDLWQEWTKWLMIGAIFSGTFLVFLNAIPDLPSGIIVVPESENLSIIYQWYSYLPGSDMIVPGNSLCISTEILNKRNETVNINIMTQLTLPDGNETTVSKIANVGTITPGEKINFTTKGDQCVHIKESGLNTWRISFFEYTGRERKDVLTHDLFILVRTQDEYNGRINLLYASLAGVILFVMQIPNFMKTLKNLFENEYKR